jgi:hypothetical protein
LAASGAEVIIPLAWNERVTAGQDEAYPHALPHQSQ